MTQSNHIIVHYAIPSHNIDELTTQFTRLARRARRLKLPEPTFTELRTERAERVVNGMDQVYVLHYIVVDTGTSEVKVSGWTFCATIQHTEDGNILRNIGGTDLPPQYRTASDYCEHCKTNRYRKETYILRNDATGQYKQVGRNCLVDYFGSDALMYADRAQYIIDLIHQCEGATGGLGSGGKQYFALEDYLAHTAEVIAHEGWISRTVAREQDKIATADIAFRHMTDPRHKHRLYDKVSLESETLARAAEEWCGNIEGEDVSEYIHNIRLIARSGVVTARTIGMAASIVSSYQRELVSREKRERAASKRPSEYVGTVGEDIEVSLLVEKILPFDSLDYGRSYLHIMSDALGNGFTWFTKSLDLDEGKTYTLRGKVKEHKLYQNNPKYAAVKQTCLTRCAVVQLRTYAVVVDGREFVGTAVSEKEFQGRAKEALGVKRWSKAYKITDMSQADAPEPREYHDVRDPMFNTYVT